MIRLRWVFIVMPGHYWRRQIGLGLPVRGRITEPGHLGPPSNQPSADSRPAADEVPIVRRAAPADDAMMMQCRHGLLRQATSHGDLREPSGFKADTENTVWNYKSCNRRSSLPAHQLLPVRLLHPSTKDIT